jgi:hypothetical protein
MKCSRKTSITQENPIRGPRLKHIKPTHLENKVPITESPEMAHSRCSPVHELIARLVQEGPEKNQCPYSLKHNLDECDSLNKWRFDQRVEARITWINGSTYLIAQPQPSSKGDPRRPLTRSVHRTTRDRAGRTYHLVCRAKPTQGAHLQPPQEQWSGASKARGGTSYGRSCLEIRPHLL